jgi:glycosyltransferase involved in cell wall biosynthesis
VRRGMHVGVDASRTVVGRRTGTENYALHLTRTLAETAGERRLRLYFNTRPPDNLLPETSRCRHRVIPWPRLWTHFRLSAELLQHPPDALFVPAHVLPIVCPVPAVVTVHDLGYLAYPEAHHPFDRWYLDWTTRRHVRVAAHLMADSDATRRDLIRHYGADPDGITVVHPGVDPAFRPITDPNRLAAARARYGIGLCYVIHVGTLQPRKNVGPLLDAFEQLDTAELPVPSSELQLVLAGKVGWLADDLVARVRDFGDRVLLTGHVAQEDLPALISGARALVMPSLYEGFGFPVLEAMACATPVVASTASSLPEVAGDAALLADPQATDALATALQRVLTDSELRDELRARGLVRARAFTWERAARLTWDVLEAAVR